MRYSVTENTLTLERFAAEDVRRKIDNPAHGRVIDPQRTGSDELICHDTNPLTVKTRHGSIV